jgi:hypothetical protein
MRNENICPICKSKFTPRRSTARFCGDRCRKTASRSTATASRKPHSAFLSVTEASGTYRGPSVDDVTLKSKTKLDRRLVPDEKWPGMFRLRLPDGSLTDMVNRTRAKDALRSLDERRRP